MYCVGMTGNIASGKSTATATFQSYGVTVINADLVARKLTRHSMPAFQAIKDHFGGHILTANEELDRAALRKLIFSNPGQKQWLENLLHPLIRKEIEKEASESKGPYCIIEIPLLKSKADYPYISRILVILAEKEKQIERLTTRDQCSREEALGIINSQPSDNARKKLADDLIFNNGSIFQLTTQVKRLHDFYLKQAALLK